MNSLNLPKYLLYRVIDTASLIINLINLTYLIFEL